MDSELNCAAILTGFFIRVSIAKRNRNFVQNDILWGAENDTGGLRVRPTGEKTDGLKSVPLEGRHTGN